MVAALWNSHKDIVGEYARWWTVPKCWGDLRRIKREWCKWQCRQGILWQSDCISDVFAHYSLFSFCPISGHVSEKAWMFFLFKQLEIQTTQTQPHTQEPSAQLHQLTTIKAKPISFPCSLKTFHSNLGGLPIIPRKLCYMSNKPFITSLVRMLSLVSP